MNIRDAPDHKITGYWISEKIVTISGQISGRDNYRMVIWLNTEYFPDIQCISNEYYIKK